MRKEFKLDLRHQIKSFRVNFEALALCIVGGLVVPLIRKDALYSEALIIVLLVWLVSSVLLSIPFHLQYLFENWDTKLIVDDNVKIIQIIKDRITYSFNFSDIKTERHLIGNHNPRGYGKSWRPIPFDYYGYVKIKTNDNKFFIITSLMTDPFNFPLPIDQTIYGITFIKGDISIKEKRGQIIKVKEKKITEFMNTFIDLSDEKLLFKIENNSKYDKEAVEAAKRILEKRKKST